MTELITYIAKALVDRPEQVALRESQAPDGGMLLELKVAPEDVGKVIGRDGRTINAMRTLLVAAAQKSGTRARLEVLDDRRGEQAGAVASPLPPEAG